MTIKIPVDRLSPMQEEMITTVRSGSNVMLLSPTGSGKTLAYMIPLCERLRADNRPQIAVVVPSRELALQSEAVFRSLNLSYKALPLYGGRPTMDEHRRLRTIEPAVLFATPGRLLDHIQKENFSVEGIDTLVLDEFDKCLELGFQEQIESIVQMLPNVRQIVLTSATFAENLPDFIEERIHGKLEIISYLEGKTPMADRLELYAVKAPQKDKLETLAHLLSTLGAKSSMVFVGHRESAERIGKYLVGEGFSAEVYHGGMEQDHREHALFKFRTKCRNILVATDLAARGLDIEEVSAVIHYHLPNNEETFTHRNGRTARWDAEGKAFLIVGVEEHLPEFAEHAKPLCVEEVPIRPFAPEWVTIYIGRGKKDKLSKGDIAGFLCKKGGLKMNQVGMIELSAHHAYASIDRRALKRCLTVIRGEKIKGMKTIIEEMRR